MVLPEYKSKYERLIAYQSVIGWEQIFKGRFVLEWKEVIDNHINSLPIILRSGVSGDSWVLVIN